MFECDDPLYVAQRNMERAIEDARDAAAYANADNDNLKRENKSLHQRVSKLEGLVERLCKAVTLPPEPAKPIEPSTEPPVKGFVYGKPYKFDARLWLEYGAKEKQIATVLAENPINVEDIVGYLQLGTDTLNLRDFDVAYISADQTAQWLKVNRPALLLSQLRGDRHEGCY